MTSLPLWQKILHYGGELVLAGGIGWGLYMRWAVGI